MNGRKVAHKYVNCRTIERQIVNFEKPAHKQAKNTKKSQKYFQNITPSFKLLSLKRMLQLQWFLKLNNSCINVCVT